MAAKADEWRAADDRQGYDGPYDDTKAVAKQNAYNHCANLAAEYEAEAEKEMAVLRQLLADAHNEIGRQHYEARTEIEGIAGRRDAVYSAYNSLVDYVWERHGVRIVRCISSSCSVEWHEVEDDGWQAEAHGHPASHVDEFAPHVDRPGRIASMETLPGVDVSRPDDHGIVRRLP